MTQVRRRLIDLFNLRDDVHVAAWQKTGVNGQTWETLTFVWRGDARTAEQLVEKLPYRDFDQASYQAVLEDLAARHWIAAEEEEFKITELGAKLRQEAEDETDRLFDAPWAALSEGEVKELRGLLAQLAEAIKPPEI